MLTLLSALSLAWATHVTTYDVNVSWTKAPFSGMESLVVEPATFIQQLRPVAGALPPLAEAWSNEAVAGEKALVFTNPLQSWAKMKINDTYVGTIGPYTTMRIDGARTGNYLIQLEVPTAHVRTFAVRVLPAVRVPPPVMVRVTKERIDLSDNVYFEFDSSVIRSESHGLLDAVAKAIGEHPELLLVRVEGHTDSQGDADYNQKLSDARAASVRDYLVKAGVALERFNAVGFGESKPVDPADTDEAFEKNRRVEFIVEKLQEVAPPEPVAPPKKKKGK